MNESNKKINPQLLKAILFALLVLLPFALYLSMSIPMVSYVLYGLLLAVFAVIVVVS